jgi:hypothetical protein
MAEVAVYCHMCPEKVKMDLSLPEGWALRYDAIDEESAFCPEHSPARQFLEDQCPGCVAGWPHCGLTESYEYPTRRTITERDFATIGCGTCPFRVNGTLMTVNEPDHFELREIDLSEPSPGGEAMVTAIRSYIERYPTPPDWPTEAWGTRRTDDNGTKWECHGTWQQVLA